MAESDQFDTLLGGKINVPSSVNVLQFSTVRYKEIEAMKKMLDEPAGTKMAFQRLPKHMRRRIMSHNVKRLPRRVRQIHMSQQQKSGVPPKSKRPSRKYRRRASNLLSEYTRRQRRINWLETHIWHAKRFHMIERWGYKIPDRPCDKAFRACYRASMKHCLIQDISYYACIELQGSGELLVSSLRDLCDPTAGLTFSAKAYLNGTRNGEVFLYSDITLKKCLGKVLFNWKPKISTNNVLDENRTIWIWCHPAFHKEVLQALTSTFNNTSVSVTDLKYDFNRFRLTGPLTQSVLQRAFKSANFANSCKWFSEFVTKNHDLCQKQTEYWLQAENITTSNQFPARCVFCLNVEDPRYNFPKKRTKALPEFNQNSHCFAGEVTADMSLGAIWEKELRERCLEDKLSSAELCKLRGKQLVPGSDIEADPPVIPIMLLHRPGTATKELVYGSGWDLIIPYGWGRAAWLALVMWGGRAGGLRESKSMNYEENKISTFQPDTFAGTEEEKRLTSWYKTKFFNLPPNKRVNYNKFAIISPFSHPWHQLLREWNAKREAEDFHVLRNRKMLNKIQECLSNKKTIQIDSELNFLIPVIVTMPNGGTPNKFSIICIPKAKDFADNRKIIEPLKKDSNQNERKTTRKEHKVLLKRLRKRRVRAKKQGRPIPAVDKNMLESYTEKMRQLWLPELSENISLRNSCSREIIGFVTEGGFCFTAAVGKGIGYIALGCLNKLIDAFGNKVLVRNTNSRIYKSGLLRIIT